MILKYYNEIGVLKIVNVALEILSRIYNFKNMFVIFIIKVTLKNFFLLFGLNNSKYFKFYINI